MTKLLRYACMLFFLASMPILTKAQCTVSAGSTINKCIFSMDSVQLHGTVAGNFTVYNWTSTGTGLVGSSTTLNAYYKYNQADITNGSVTLTLTASGGTCGSVSSQVTINLAKRPTVVGQNEFTVCGSTVPLTSTATGASAFVWRAMSGSGTFSSTTTANTQYTATAADITTGFVLLEIKGTTAMSGCFHQDTVRVNLAPSVSLNAGTDQTVCTAPVSTVVSSSATGAYTSYLWTTSGTGTFSNPTQLLSPYILSAADIAAGSVTLTLTGNSATCGSASDSRVVTVLQRPVVSAGADQTICGNTAALSGTVTPSSGVTLEWLNIIGLGTFSNTSVLAPIYTITADDQNRGYALLRLRGTSSTGCTSEDTVQVNIATNASLNAGFDETICAAANTTVSSTATATPGFTSYLWTTSGTGTFSIPTQLSSPYIFSAADIAAGSVTLTLTGNSVCGNTFDVRVITILQRPIVSAGVDQTICVNTAALNGTVTPSAGATIEWFNVIGNGTFSNASALAPTYTATAADQTRGYVLVRLRAISSAACSNEDTVRLNLSSSPVVFAGSNQTSCSGTITVHGYAIKATSKTWTTSGTGTFANASKDTTVYTPSSADRTLGQVTLTYTGTNACSTASSTTKITFIQTAPLINAGIDETICGKDTIQLAGSVVNATGGTWTTSGTGNFLLPPSHLANLYKLSAADKIAGSVSFTLTSYSSGGCGAVSDVRTLTILSGSLPTVNAGADQTSSISTQLNATVSNATALLWHTSGAGVFVPNPTSSNVSYIPSADDIAAGSVLLTLDATNSCGVASDALTIFTATPSSISGTVKAGTNTLDYGVVYLYAVTGAQGRGLVGIDTIYPSSNGAYEFSTVAAGNYNVYAVPFSSSVYAATYLATYLGSAATTAWETAGQEEVTNGSGAHILNVDLLTYTSALPNWNTGTDAISGGVFLYTPVAIMRVVGVFDKPVAGAVVYLKSLDGQVIAYTSTNKYGIYTFSNVLPGNYYVDPEYSYTALLEDKLVAVDGNAQTVEDGNTILRRSYLTTGVLSSSKSMQINVYPNPTADNVHVQLPKTGNYSIKVLDETGVVHIEQQVSVTSGVVSDISLAGLNKGLYIIQITSGEDVYNTKVVKF